jgi:hypothetical protein
MWPDKATMSSSQVHAQLKEKVRQKWERHRILWNHRFLISP